MLYCSGHCNNNMQHSGKLKLDSCSCNNVHKTKRNSDLVPFAHRDFDRYPGFCRDSKRYQKYLVTADFIKHRASSSTAFKRVGCSRLYITDYMLRLDKFRRP